MHAVPNVTEPDVEPVTFGRVLGAATLAGVEVPDPAAFDALVRFLTRFGIRVEDTTPGQSLGSVPAIVSDPRILIDAELERLTGPGSFIPAEHFESNPAALQKAATLLSLFAGGAVPGRWPYVPEAWEVPSRLQSYVRAGALYLAALNAPTRDGLYETEPPQLEAALGTCEDLIEGLLRTLRQDLEFTTGLTPGYVAVDAGDLDVLLAAAQVADEAELLPACPSDPCPTCTALQNVTVAVETARAPSDPEGARHH